MNYSYLPLDVCELIIDECRIPRKGSDNVRARSIISYRTLCRTALVCTKWVPRSQYNLLYEVVVWTEAHVYLLTRTLTDAPHLGSHIRIFGVDPFMNYFTGPANALQRRGPVTIHWKHVPFASGLALPRLLTNCATLTLKMSDGTPAWYYDMAFHRLSELKIVELNIRELDPRLAPAAFRMIWASPTLRKLHIIYSCVRSMEEAGEYVPTRALLNERHHYHGCSGLQSLWSNSHFRSPLVVPPDAFGGSVEKLMMTNTPKPALVNPVDVQALRCVRKFPKLRVLGITFELWMWRYDNSRMTEAVDEIPCSILESVVSGTALRKAVIGIKFHREKLYIHKEELERHLDRIFTDRMLHALTKFPCVDVLHIEIQTNFYDYIIWDNWPWHDQISRRLPTHLQWTLRVTIYDQDDESSLPATEAMWAEDWPRSADTAGPSPYIFTVIEASSYWIPSGFVPVIDFHFRSSQLDHVAAIAVYQTRMLYICNLHKQRDLAQVKARETPFATYLKYRRPIRTTSPGRS